MRNSNRFRIILLLVLLSTAGTILAQSSSSSPYSRFGTGSLTPASNTLIMSLGGSSSTVRSSLFVNHYNPASYTAFDTTSFIFDAALQAKITNLSTNTASFKVNDAGLSYITMGLPVTKWWKSSFGLLPYSSVGYMIGNDSVIENLGNVEFGYSGTGGINKAYFGNGFRLSEHISVGANLGYYFGTINKVRTVSYPDSSYYFRSRITNSTQVHNLVVDFGAQYYTQLKNGLTMTLGLVFTPGQSLSCTSNDLAVNYFHSYSSDLDVTKDTVLNTSDVKGDIFLPMQIGGGFSLGNSNRWTAYADFKWQQWSNYKYYGKGESFDDSYHISVGGQWKPSSNDIGEYWKRINYRAGVRFEKSYLNLRNSSLNEIGVSIGAGLPLKKSRSLLNIALEMGTFGTTNNNLIKENYFRFSLGASIFEKWFLKRKYD